MRTTKSLKPESVTDEVGNKLTDIGSTRGITVTYDTSGPTVSLALASGYTEPVSGAFDVSFTFNEPVTGFGAAFRPGAKRTDMRNVI